LNSFFPTLGVRGSNHKKKKPRANSFGPKSPKGVKKWGERGRKIKGIWGNPILLILEKWGNLQKTRLKNWSGWGRYQKSTEKLGKCGATQKKGKQTANH